MSRSSRHIHSAKLHSPGASLITPSSMALPCIQAPHSLTVHSTMLALLQKRTPSKRTLRIWTLTSPTYSFQPASAIRVA